MLQVLVGLHPRRRGGGPLARHRRRPRVLLDHQAHPQPSPRRPRRPTARSTTAAAAAYESVQTANASAIAPQVRPGDVVILHDPQTAGLAAPLKAAGAVVLWRCHVGTEVRKPIGPRRPGRSCGRIWRPVTASCSRAGSTCRRGLPMDRVSIIPPSIDPFSPKNQELSEDQRLQILAAMGVLDEAPAGAATFIRRDGSVGHVGRRAAVVAEGPLDASVPLVIQVSRWDHLKDMAGVMAGFAARVAGRGDAQLALVGPAVDDVSDDPEGHQVLEECIEAWSAVASSTAPADPTRDPPHGRWGRERGHGQRTPTSRLRHRAEEPGRRLRPDRGRRHVEGQGGRGFGRGWHRRSGGPGDRRAARRSQ